LPPVESAASLIPLLSDKDEFVRQQTAYALGETRSHTAVSDLIAWLADKKDSVRGAAAVALGQIADADAVSSLAAVLISSLGNLGKKSRKSKTKRNSFVLRAAAHSKAPPSEQAVLRALPIWPVSEPRLLRQMNSLCFTLTTFFARGCHRLLTQNRGQRTHGISIRDLTEGNCRGASN